MEDRIFAFLDYLKDEYGYSDNTVAAYKNDLSQFYNFLQTHHPEITAWPAVDEVIVSAYVEHMKEQPYAPSSVARKVAAIKSFFNYLAAGKLLDENPTEEIVSPRVKKQPPKTLSAEDAARLLAAPGQNRAPKYLRDRALLHLLYATGMRVSELVALQVDDIDLEQRQLYSPGKGDESRLLPFDEETAAVLEDYLKHGRPHLLKDEEERALFLNHRGRQLTRQGLWLIIKAYARQAGLSEDVTPHTLRHSFAAHKVESGANLQRVQQLLGHANISTTQVYMQISEGAQQEETQSDEETDKGTTAQA